ncbi:NPC intracellular cholesterol transporter 2-like [Oratosquilla oratoria]|uniref:NPC intracellular cholesterol transporter 2-like n=1 Tax=Oratosquilla oratoria TaxID=337810 RepID=UPI003F76CA9B
MNFPSSLWLTAAAMVVGVASGTLVLDCGSAATDIDFAVQDCLMPPCVVIKPGSYSIDITFTAASDAQSLKTRITATIGNIDFPWPGPDACPLLIEGECPLRKGQTYRYFVEMPVLEEYPVLDAFVTWRLTDEAGIDQICKAFPITIHAE